MHENAHQSPKDKSAAPIIAAVLLLLSVLYVASYLLLVWPDRLRYSLLDSRWEVFPKYRYGTEAWAGTMYWPLEQIDRKVRPDQWQHVGK
jgi:hypothetical protein